MLLCWAVFRRLDCGSSKRRKNLRSWRRSVHACVCAHARIMASAHAAGGGVVSRRIHVAAQERKAGGKPPRAETPKAEPLPADGTEPSVLWSPNGGDLHRQLAPPALVGTAVRTVSD